MLETNNPLLAINSLTQSGPLTDAHLNTQGNDQNGLLPGDHTRFSLMPLQGTDTDDALLGTAQDNWILGRQGNDYLNGYVGNDYLFGQSGEDRLFGSSGNDWLVAGLGNDELVGGSGQDQLWGEQGNDRLDGGTDTDRLLGGQGDDSLIDQDGGDQLTGGRGQDSFWIGNRSLGASVITDFQVNQDRLKLMDSTITYEQLQLRDSQKGVVIAYQGNDLAILEGVKKAKLSPDQFEFGNAQLAQNLQTSLQQVVESTGTPGAASFVTLPDGSVWTGAAGVTDTEAGTPMTVNDRFNIASITKPIVATVTLQLEQEGILSLNDTLSKWLPEIAQALTYGDQITIQQLLNHTSGVQEYINQNGLLEEALTDPSVLQRPWTTAELLSRYVYGKQPFAAPGQGSYYSNTNYRLLESVIEAATQTSLGQQLQTRIFDPLGMTNSFYANPEQIPGGLTSGYLDIDGNGTLDVNTNTVNLLGTEGGAGGIISTVADVSRFYQSLLNSELLSPSSLAQLQAESFGIGSGTLPDGTQVTGAAGRGLGWSGNAYTLLQSGISITNLTNSESLPTEPDRQLFYQLLGTITNQTITPTTPFTPLTPS
jgi:CubicO group peptidase (beta-lactamase class C family)